MSTLPVEIIKMFKEYNNDGSKVHLKQLLEVGYEGFIPSCVILNKTLPGLGATSCEIESKRHSIIIEPNVPVIDGKQAKYPNERWDYKILGVRKGVKKATIKEYLLNKNIPYKKIVTTPESYIHKVLPVFKDLEMADYTSTFFLLLDESEKFVQDSDFRNSLFEVMKDFWKFDNKALVSATPIIPSDKAYQEQDFRVMQILPLFDYAKELTTISTNSVLDSVKSIYNEELTTDKICFFINSVTIIDNIIKRLDIKDDARIFCGEDSIATVKEMGYEDYSTTIKVVNELADLKRINFFTSRFFSAVDIDLKDDNVSVIMVTDNYVAPHSALDPHTHVKQIIGRFRNQTQFNCHIFNTRDDVEYRSKDDVLKFIKGNHSGFKAIHTLYLNEPDPVIKKAFKGQLHQLKFMDYLYPYKGRLAVNWLLIDNEIEEEKVKGLYLTSANLTTAYHQDKFYSPNTRSKIYNNDDKLRYKIDKLNLRSLRALMVNVFYKIWNCELDGIITDYFTDYQLQKEGNYILGAVHYIEREDLGKNDYDPKILDVILDDILKKDVTANLQFRKDIRTNFMKGVQYSRKAISFRLERLFKKYGIKGTTKATRLSDYCVLSPEGTVRKNAIKMPDEDRPKGFVIEDYLFSINETILL
jgi:hypothetical protein